MVPSPPRTRSQRASRVRRARRTRGVCACWFLSSTPFTVGTPTEAPRFPHPLDGEDDLAELLAGLEPLVRRADLLERQHGVDDRKRAAACDELVGAGEVLSGTHRGAKDRELLPPDPVQRSRRVRP